MRPPDARSDGPALTDDELRVLGLLADGLTDAAAASRLGCTERTVRRRLGEAMTKLGSRSRFQTGYEVCRRRLFVPVRAGSDHHPSAGSGQQRAEDRPETAR